MLVAETEYKHQVETDIRPFHDVLLGLFFITIGMKLDWRPVLEQWYLVLLLTMRAGAGEVRAHRGAGTAVPRHARAWRCARACTSRRPASSASCC
jgi:Kef-type K+ transport system membrane component KefB